MCVEQTSSEHFCPQGWRARLSDEKLDHFAVRSSTRVSPAADVLSLSHATSQSTVLAKPADVTSWSITNKQLVGRKRCAQTVRTTADPWAASGGRQSAPHPLVPTSRDHSSDAFVQDAAR